MRLLALSVVVLVLAVLVGVLRPVRAWRAGSAALDDAELVGDRRVLRVESELAIAPIEGGVRVTTGDGGGAGTIVGLARTEPLRVARAERGWEIGTRPGAPAVYIDDDGIRLDDGMIDRLAVRAWPLASVIVAAALGIDLVVRRRKVPRPERYRAAIACLLLAAALVVSLR